MALDKSNKPPFNPKQVEFIQNATAKYNLAHGAVRSGKTVCTLFAFLQAAFDCPGNSLFIIGYSLTTIYRNVISLLFESNELKFFAPFCSWHAGSHTLLFVNKKIKCIGAGDEGAMGIIQGLTIDLCYCDEMTLYPENVIDMIDTRLSRDHSQLFASMNPKHPDHKLKQWIDKAEAGNPLYYALHFTIDDNALFLPKDYRENLKDSLKGLFYKRNYLGQWCMAEGAIFDCFDRKWHVKERAPCAADYYIVGIDFGISLCFAAVMVGVATGYATQTGKKFWVEKEYYWDVSKTNRQKTVSEYTRDMIAFTEDYPLKGIFVDPSASALILEMKRLRLYVREAENDVLLGINKVSSLLGEGTLTILDNCHNLIREIEAYVWDAKKGQRGLDAPVKKNDHAVDSLRYALASHKVAPPVETDARTLGGFRRHGG